ncbi:MAG: pyridoxamine 5'-phosphate oxidase family protein [Eggerthellaceae bacterium]|nr:pyridoxamine 5'-phosphate oxidase family protein [Eggerthellaceae bacterium]
MFREMRRFKQQLSDEETNGILKRGKTGVLAVSGDDGYPYTVPVNYVFDGEHIFLHSARTGHKIDAIRSCDKVSFCVVDADDVVPEEYTTYFRSVVAFGRARIMEPGEALEAALRMLGDKYNPGENEALDREVAHGMARLHMIEITIEHVTGKQAKELAHVKGPLDE